MHQADGINHGAKLALGGDAFGGLGLPEEAVIEDHRRLHAALARQSEHRFALLKIVFHDVRLPVPGD